MLDTMYCQDYFNEVKAEAEKLGILPKLQERLDYLGTYGHDENANNTRCVLYKDFAPLSFFFNMQQSDGKGGWKPWFSGGLVFYKGTESGAGDPQYSVSLSSRTDSRWEVHT